MKLKLHKLQLVFKTILVYLNPSVSNTLAEYLTPFGCSKLSNFYKNQCNFKFGVRSVF